MGVGSVLRTVRWSLQKRGVGGSLRAIPAALARSRRGYEAPVHPFDERYGTDTGGVIGGGTLAVGHRNDKHIIAYAGVAPSRLRAAVQRWEASLPGGEQLGDFTFVDLGSGKGRALLLASEWRFRRVLGVELNPGLVATAERNAVLWREQGRAQTGIELRGGDATELVYPDGPCLVFLYNSFGVPVVRAVLDQLHGHVLASGARVDLLFQNEGPEMPMRSDPRLERLWSISLPLEGEDAAAELVGTPEDTTSLYRFSGKMDGNTASV